MAGVGVEVPVTNECADNRHRVPAERIGRVRTRGVPETTGWFGAFCRCCGTIFSSRCDRNMLANLASRGYDPSFVLVVRSRTLESEEGTVSS